MFKLVKVDEEERPSRVLDAMYKIVVIVGVLAALAAAACYLAKKCFPSWCGMADRDEEDDDYFCDGNCAACDLDCGELDLDDAEDIPVETEEASDDEFKE